jgi:two-component system, LuxR family, response regulator FixJ
MDDRRDLVLIVDDDQAVRDALQFALRLEGLCVHVHGGGAALLADPDLTRAGCVILGDWMRQMDGFALLRNLKARDINLPAIMLTSHATANVRARADAVGVRKVLEKPLLDNALVENIRSILNANC